MFTDEFEEEGDRTEVESSINGRQIWERKRHSSLQEASSAPSPHLQATLAVHLVPKEQKLHHQCKPALINGELLSSSAEVRTVSKLSRAKAKHPVHWKMINFQLEDVKLVHKHLYVCFFKPTSSGEELNGFYLIITKCYNRFFF